MNNFVLLDLLLFCIFHSFPSSLNSPQLKKLQLNHNKPHNKAPQELKKTNVLLASKAAFLIRNAAN